MRNRIACFPCRIKKLYASFFFFGCGFCPRNRPSTPRHFPVPFASGLFFSGTSPVQVRLTVPGRSHLLPPADTCLRVSLDATGRGEAVVEAEGYHTQRLRFWADTLPPGRYLTLRLAGAVTQLGEVVVRPDERLRQRGDTLIIATDSLRTRPHARATELLDQLPGASLSPDGTLRVLGKTVEEVTVDGKALFGGNAAATLDALQAEMIKQLELAPTGRGNANRATMNITLKDDRKNGTYGEAGGSPGTNQRQQAALRLNRIAPGRFENGFLAADNTNQRLLSPSDETRFQRNLLDRELRGAYSVMDVAETHLFNRPNDRPDAVPDLGERRGINRARNGGLNVTRSSGKTEWAGYVLADQNTQHLSQQLNRIRLLPPLQQLDTSRLDQTLQRARLWAGLSAMWRFGPRITLKTAQSLMLGREGLELANQQRFYFGEAREPPLVSGLNRNEQQQTQHRATLWQQALLTLRHRRPAQITSLYLGHEAGRTRTDRRYLNDVPFGLSRPLFNHHTLDRLDRSYSLGFQGLHSLPLSRRWLLEGRVGVQRQGFLADQTGGQLNAVGGYRFRPDLSLGGFRVADWQTDARMGVFYRQDKLSLLGSLGLWRWSSQRGLFGMYRATALLPRLYAEYRPSVRGAR
ncbi:MAG: hypothetical protein LH606_20085 [Cytophagaceae bacterium]|nr:hypothetical protein [Cytophagaceae bacterium]